MAVAAAMDQRGASDPADGSAPLAAPAEAFTRGVRRESRAEPHLVSWSHKSPEADPSRRAPRGGWCIGGAAHSADGRSAIHTIATRDRKSRVQARGFGGSVGRRPVAHERLVANSLVRTGNDSRSRRSRRHTQPEAGSLRRRAVLGSGPQMTRVAAMRVRCVWEPVQRSRGCD